MSQVYFKEGMLVLLGDDRDKNEMSFKPTNDRAFDNKTRYWGRVNDFNYSLPWETVKCVVQAFNAGDAVWIDNPLSVPNAQVRLSTQINFNTDIVATLVGDGNDMIRIDPKSVQSVVPDIVNGHTLIGIAGLDSPLTVIDGWVDLVTSLSIVGWLQLDPEPNVGAILV